ncbi:MAG: twin-arginine translocation signal domain-containing protein, partial [Verrucomicrobiaceae bacterium]
MSKDIHQSRRHFLKLCSLAGLGVAAPVCLPAPARAASDDPYEGPFYVVLNASGGWDTTCLMDPKGTGGINALYREDDILTRGAHRFAPTKAHIQGGMSNEEFYTEYGGE